MFFDYPPFILKKNLDCFSWHLSDTSCHSLPIIDETHLLVDLLMGKDIFCLTYQKSWLILSTIQYQNNMSEQILPQFASVTLNSNEIRPQATRCIPPTRLVPRSQPCIFTSLASESNASYHGLNIRQNSAFRPISDVIQQQHDNTVVRPQQETSQFENFEEFELQTPREVTLSDFFLLAPGASSAASEQRPANLRREENVPSVPSTPFSFRDAPIGPSFFPRLSRGDKDQEKSPVQSRSSRLTMRPRMRLQPRLKRRDFTRS